jgi:hypothetical protein
MRKIALAVALLSALFAPAVAEEQGATEYKSVAELKGRFPGNVGQTVIVRGVGMYMSNFLALSDPANDLLLVPTGIDGLKDDVKIKIIQQCSLPKSCRMRVTGIVTNQGQPFIKATEITPR